MYLFEAVEKLRERGWTWQEIGDLGDISAASASRIARGKVRVTRNEKLAHALERELKLKRDTLMRVYAWEL